jgi:hypothetical protein
MSDPELILLLVALVLSTLFLLVLGHVLKNLLPLPSPLIDLQIIRRLLIDLHDPLPYLPRRVPFIKLHISPTNLHAILQLLEPCRDYLRVEFEAFGLFLGLPADEVEE